MGRTPWVLVVCLVMTADILFTSVLAELDDARARAAAPTIHTSAASVRHDSALKSLEERQREIKE
ncbi:hypothetical protein AURDEDRAFT_178416 [Auricularia subglabra TFB-10046 SS5]|uniref:Uncharacterized protein n=1 Tax=Auricularia subglabra (strain TFB-10046 / SS5) TaxID=717982 RepID=J0WL72_AURST|nr:hypothetical protein AURDEDRAFT_178416 [Auricularia subglabra TFB-10046 SS5]